MRGFTFPVSCWYMGSPDAWIMIALCLFLLAVVHYRFWFWCNCTKSSLHNNRTIPSSTRVRPQTQKQKLPASATSHNSKTPMISYHPSGIMLRRQGSLQDQYASRRPRMQNTKKTAKKIAFLHLAPILGEVESNLQLVIKAVRQAVAHGASWILTPELSL